MAHLNKTFLIGRLTDNPEPPKTTQGGAVLVKFRFVSGRSRKNQQTGQWENDPNPLYIDCNVWSRNESRALCDLVSNHCQRGTQLHLEGSLRYETWQDTQTGQTRSKHVLVVESIQILSQPGEHQGGGQQHAPTQQQRPPANGRHQGNGQYRPAPQYGPPPDDGDPADIPF